MSLYGSSFTIGSCAKTSKSDGRVTWFVVVVLLREMQLVRSCLPLPLSDVGAEGGEHANEIEAQFVGTGQRQAEHYGNEW